MGGVLIELSLDPKRPKIKLCRAGLAAWLVPYNHTSILLNLDPDSAKQRLDELRRRADYTVWERKRNLILFPHHNYANTYRPLAVLRFEPRDHRTELKINFFSPGVLLMLAFVLAGTGTALRFANWSAASGMAMAALGVHFMCSLFCQREQRDIAYDVACLIGDTLVR